MPISISKPYQISSRALFIVLELGTGNSDRLVIENQIVCLEDLNVSGMLKNRKLSTAISQAGWRMFRFVLSARRKPLNIAVTSELSTGGNLHLRYVLNVATNGAS